MFIFFKSSIMKFEILREKGKGNRMAVKNGKKKWIIIVAVVVVLSLVFGLVIVGTRKKEEPKASGSVEQIKRRTIVNSITANGIVEAANTENVTGGSYGMKVDAVYVKEGDVVATGDVICIFNTEDIDEQIKNVQDNIADTKADKLTQIADYDEQIAEQKATNAENLAEAKENLKQAESTLAEEKKELAKWEKKYADGMANGSLTISEELELVSTINSQKSTVDNAQNRVDNYNSRVETLEEADTTNLEDAKENYTESIDNTIDNYEEQLKMLKEQKDACTIKAGISGVITAINVSENSNFNGGTIASIEGVDYFIIEAQVEEYDVADVAVGMKVLVKTDATRDKELEGVITYVAPRATNSGSSSMGDLSSLMGGMDTSSFTGTSGSSTYLVKIELKEQNDRLRLGMNAKTSIIIEESTDVWSVPYDAVMTREDGTTYLQEVTGKDEEGNYVTKELNITVGLQGTYYVEIQAEGISEKTKILVPDAQGNSSIEELLNMMGAGAGI